MFDWEEFKILFYSIFTAVLAICMGAFLAMVIIGAGLGIFDKLTSPTVIVYSEGSEIFHGSNACVKVRYSENSSVTKASVSIYRGPLCMIADEIFTAKDIVIETVK